MKIIRGFANLNNQFTQCVLTLGNFDGLHLGHQQLINQLVTQGKKLNLPTVVMLFEPQPLEFFGSDKAPPRLTSFREKYLLLQSFNIDYLLVIPFNQHFANMGAVEFIEQGIIRQLNAKYVIVGDDFCFGIHRQGNVALLQDYAEKAFFELVCMSTYIIDQLRVSSTAVRKALANDDFNLASRLLGRPYVIQGYVVHGNQLARQLGFPTANIWLNRRKPAVHGVYFVKISDHYSRQQYYGIANIGIRPTVNGTTAILEVNIFDFSGNIYGHCLAIEFIEKIRNEFKFDSLTALQRQIAQDICIAKQIQAKFMQ
ncbi:bifunctional riboflavin kinase/FAD synthetase [Frischella sp. Ac13]|uniref:Riboflavin biosynthesis protein n=1 Tax=Frischella japonica TaxID=2741544 RepID=A0ABR7QWU9_9GAMM|nr:bifunctional riboflavin kinase/FAD synthetase [Frischella japonica]MBC9130458.1 bifunctional riboflavin kinase/FAD synthetase [Frischella japonica]